MVAVYREELIHGENDEEPSSINYQQMDV